MTYHDIDTVATLTKQGFWPGEIGRILHAAKMLHRLAEHACNHGPSKAQEMQRRSLVRDIDETLERAVMDRRVANGAQAIYSRDTRGYAVRIRFGGDGPWNTAGGAPAGWGIA